MHVAATVRFAELKISREEFRALRRLTAAAAAVTVTAAIYCAPLLVRLSAKRPEIFQRKGISEPAGSRGRLDKTQKEISGAATSNEMDFH